MAEPSALCLIIVAWNQLEKTLACLATAVAQTYPHLHILLIDNGSQPPLAPLITPHFPQVEIVRQAHNLGFAGGYNSGLRHALAAGYDLFFILNNDTLLAPDCAAQLAAAATAAPDIGLVTAKIYYAHDRQRIWSVGSAIHPWLLEIMHDGHLQLDSGQWTQPREVDFVPLCGVILTRAVVEQVGLLDEAFFVYYEDMDYCLRARQAGFRLWLAPQAHIWHAVSVSSGGRYSPAERYWMAQSSGRYFRKQGQGWRMMLIVPYRLASALKMSLRLLRQRRGRALRAYWLGLYRGWRTGQATMPPPDWVYEE